MQRQVDAYNARNIDPFMDTYSDAIEIYDFPNVLYIAHKDKMRKEFKDIFYSVPNL